MDWKIIAATFVTVFLAELGDKTQLASFCMATSKKCYLEVIIGAVSALALVTILSVILAMILNRTLSENVLKYVRYGAASLFIVIGILMFAGKM